MKRLIVFLPYLVIILLLGFVLLIGVSALGHGKYADRYLDACHADGGVRVTVSRGKGWSQYVCIKNTAVVGMGDLESRLVITGEK